MRRFDAGSACTAPPRQRVIRIFPNRQSGERLLGALLMEFDEQMSYGKIYVGMDEYHAWRAARSAVRMSELKLAENSETQAPEDLKMSDFRV